MWTVGGLFVLAAVWSIPTGAATAAPKGGGRKESAIKLCITFIPGGGIQSDGAGDYCDGKKSKVAAAFGSFFRLETNYTGNVGGRTLCFNFLDLADAVNMPPFELGCPIEATVFSELPASDMESMGIGTSRMIAMRFHFPPEPNLRDLSWFLLFGETQNGPRCPEGSPSNEVQLTRWNSDTWVIKTLPEQDIACLLLGPDEFRGHFHMPFEMWLARKP